jgi:hypothetical protein
VPPTTETVESLILDLLEWVQARERSYEEVIEAWRTSCPKLPVWEDANDRALIRVERIGSTSFVRVTSKGSTLLGEHRPSR